MGPRRAEGPVSDYPDLAQVVGEGHQSPGLRWGHQEGRAMTRGQLCILRCLEGRGAETTLLPILLSRAGATLPEWQTLRDRGFIQEEDFRFTLTEMGRREFRKAKKEATRLGHYF